MDAQTALNMLQNRFKELEVDARHPASQAICEFRTKIRDMKQQTEKEVIAVIASFLCNPLIQARLSVALLRRAKEAADKALERQQAADCASSCGPAGYESSKKKKGSVGS